MVGMARRLQYDRGSQTECTTSAEVVAELDSHDVADTTRSPALSPRLGAALGS